MMAGWLIMVLLYLLVTAYVGRRRMERCQGADMTEERRIAQYRFSLLWNAGTLLGMFVLMGLASVGWEEIGLRPVQLRPGGGIVLGAVLFLCVVLTALFLYQMLAFQCSVRYRESMTALMTQKRNAGGLYERTVDSLIPRSRREKRWFFFTSFAAGLCEEIIFRGFFLYLLGRAFPAAPWFLLAAAAGFMFGVAHFYQGVKGVFKTALLGTMFGLLYLGTNSVVLCVPLHILFDFSSAFLYESGDE